MKKLTFKVGSKENFSVVSLIKEVNKISCRIYLDFENGFVTVENVSDIMIDTVIDLVDNYYTILAVDIDNIFEELAEYHDVSMVTETVEETAEPETVEEPTEPETVEKTMDSETVEEATEPETVEVITEKRPIVLEPQSEDDLIIKKVEFENELVEYRINNFLKTAYWALYTRSATEKDISDYILTYTAEISMRYTSKPIIEFSVGDIVDVNYGSHLPGEIMGGHVHAIVCNILHENMAYVVPITKVRTDLSSLSYLFIDAPQDATYNNEYYKCGTVLVDKGRYLRVERFNSVIGKTKPEFFEKLLYQLAYAFDFTGYLAETVEDDNDLPFTIGEPTDEVIETSDVTEDADDETVETSVVTEDAENEAVEAPTVTDETTDEDVESPTLTEASTNDEAKTKSTTKKVSEEAALLETIGFAFDKLDSSKTVEEQVESFLTDIGMTTTERMVTLSFIIACDIKKINYENVILGLKKYFFPQVKEEMIKKLLQEAFKNWLEKYPTLAENCPKISLMAILKVFAKKFA